MISLLCAVFVGALMTAPAQAVPADTSFKVMSLKKDNLPATAQLDLVHNMEQLQLSGELYDNAFSLFLSKDGRSQAEIQIFGIDQYAAVSFYFRGRQSGKIYLARRHGNDFELLVAQPILTTGAGALVAFDQQVAGRIQDRDGFKDAQIFYALKALIGDRSLTLNQLIDEVARGPLPRPEVPKPMLALPDVGPIPQPRPEPPMEIPPATVAPAPSIVAEAPATEPSVVEPVATIAETPTAESQVTEPSAVKSPADVAAPTATASEPAKITSAEDVKSEDQKVEPSTTVPATVIPAVTGSDSAEAKTKSIVKVDTAKAAPSPSVIKVPAEETPLQSEVLLPQQGPLPSPRPARLRMADSDTTHYKRVKKLRKAPDLFLPAQPPIISEP